VTYAELLDHLTSRHRIEPAQLERIGGWQSSAVWAAHAAFHDRGDCDHAHQRATAPYQHTGPVAG
jgi:hypothetical protein